MADSPARRLRKARVSLIKNQRKTDMWSSVLGTIGSAYYFGAGQAEEATTAWKEYEEGYKALKGTDPIVRPKFGEEGWLKSTFKGPEGKVTIGDGLYDIESVRKAGAFLGGESSAILDDQSRKRYLERVAPNLRPIPSIPVPFGDESYDDAGAVDMFSAKEDIRGANYDWQYNISPSNIPKFEEREKPTSKLPNLWQNYWQGEPDIDEDFSEETVGYFGKKNNLMQSLELNNRNRIRYG